MRLGPPITSRSNVRVKALRAAFNGEASRPGDLLGIEGENLITEAVRSISVLEAVYVREDSQAMLSRLSLEHVEVKQWAVLARDVFDAALPTRSPQGIAATFRIPGPAPRIDGRSASKQGVSLVLAGVQDPGNLGTLLRSAEAFGVLRVLATLDTVNAWNPKAVRASAGSAFRIPVQRGTLEQIQSWLRELGGAVYAAVAAPSAAETTAAAATHSADATPRKVFSIADVDFRPPCAVMLGSEGNGLPREALVLADAAVWIPCATESLNAAAAGSIFMYECMRQNAGRVLCQHSDEHSTRGREQHLWEGDAR